MSTYYYLVCETHNEIAPAASRTAGGYGHLSGSATLLPAFIIAHAACDVKIRSEHYDDVYNPAVYRFWSTDRIDQEVDLAKSEGRWK